MTKVIFLGTGTSSGIPQVACSCFVCSSPDPKNKRQRSSLYLETKKSKILVDTGPDVKNQLIRHQIQDLDGIIITHHHMDHCVGIDDLKYISYKKEKILKFYCFEKTYQALKVMFSYFFHHENIEFHIVKEGWNKICEENFYLQEVPHTKSMQTLSFYFEGLIYLTDFAAISDSYHDFLLKNKIELFIIELLRKHPRKGHHCFFQVLSFLKKYQYKEAYCVHLSHYLEHEALEDELKKTNINLRPAYDGLIKEIK